MALSHSVSHSVGLMIMAEWLDRVSELEPPIGIEPMTYSLRVHEDRGSTGVGEGKEPGQKPTLTPSTPVYIDGNCYPDCYPAEGYHRDPWGAAWRASSSARRASVSANARPQPAQAPAPLILPPARQRTPPTYSPQQPSSSS
jgi:hypothetical protein